jgi:hypothetical protein
LAQNGLESGKKKIAFSLWDGKFVALNMTIPRLTGRFLKLNTPLGDSFVAESILLKDTFLNRRITNEEEFKHQ